MTKMDILLNLATAGFRYLTGTDSNDQNPLSVPSSFNTHPGSSTFAAMYTPSYADICVARAMLESLKLPTELVLEVLAYAQYEPVVEFNGYRNIVASASMGSANSAHTCLRAEVLSEATIRRLSGPHVTLKVKEIKFDFTSKDQGWTSENTRGTYNTSSWLEVSIFRPRSKMIRLEDLNGIDDHDGLAAVQNYLVSQEYGALVSERPPQAEMGAQGGEPPLAWYLQGNKVCERQNCDYQVIWAPDHNEGNEGAGSGQGFFDALKHGDSVLVWARSKVGTKILTPRSNSASLAETPRLGNDS